MVGVVRRTVPALATHLADPLYRNGYLLMMNNVVGATLGFVFWVVAARAFPPEAVGLGAAWVSALTLAAVLGKFGMDAAVIRFVPGATVEARRSIVARSMATVGFASAGLAIAFVLLGPRGVFAPVASSPLLFVAFVAGAVGNGLGWVIDAVFVAQARADLSLARNSAFNLLKLALLVLAVGIVPAWSAGLVAGGLAVGLLLPRLVAYDPGRAAAPPAGPFWRYAAANFAQNVTEYGPGLALPLMVAQFAGERATAHFYAAWTLAFVGMLASKAIAQSTFADIARARRPAAEALRKALFQHALALTPIVLGGLLAGRLILSAYGSEYAEAATTALAILLLSIPGFASLNLYLTWIRAHNAGRELVLLPLVFLVVSLAPAPFALQAGGIEALALVWTSAATAVGLYSALRLARAARGERIG